MTRNSLKRSSSGIIPSPIISSIPIICLLLTLTIIIFSKGASEVQDHAPAILLSAAIVGVIVSVLSTPGRPKRMLWEGLKRSASQVLPTVPILLFIGTLSATWMLSGVVPVMIDYGLAVMNPRWFLPTACAICSIVSVLTGSSWTTIATIGVGFMGIGTVMGYESGWVAGAIISGAYFGDKVSPLSDTTVLAAASCDVPLMTHIRNLMWTSLPALILALGVFSCVGIFTPVHASEKSLEMVDAIRSMFNLSPWLFVVPLITALLIALRCPTVLTLAVGSIAGLIAMFLFQPHIVEMISDSTVLAVIDTLFTGTALSTGSELLDPLVSTGGMFGMIPTILLVISAMIFGGIMIGSGMLEAITGYVTRSINTSRGLIATTCGSGLFLNSCTGDQYLSIIVGGNVFRDAYTSKRIHSSTLSRTLEDSVSVTSVLIPWNSCGVTQSTVLGVATLTYLPFCIFNICSPVMTVLLALAGWKIRQARMVNDSLHCETSPAHAVFPASSD